MPSTVSYKFLQGSNIKTVTTTIYDFDELCPESQQNALDILGREFSGTELMLETRNGHKFTIDGKLY